jgi:hypothetical protein
MLAALYLVAELEEPGSQMGTLSLVSSSTVAESINGRAAPHHREQLVHPSGGRVRLG